MKKTVKGFKGFDKDLKCRGYQFEIGKTFEEKEAILCSKGFHFCENPFDVFSYYSPSDSRFCTVDGLNTSDEKESDSKRCSKKLKINAEIGLSGLINAGVEYIIEKVDFKNDKESNTGSYSAATNTGSYSAATNTGSYSAATNTGNHSAATNTGYQSAATNTGNHSAATVSDGGSVAVVIGYKSKAKAKKGSAIVVCERDDNMNLINIKAAIIDGNILKEDTFYFLSNGEFVEEI